MNLYICYYYIMSCAVCESASRAVSARRRRRINIYSQTHTRRRLFDDGSTIKLNLVVPCWMAKTKKAARAYARSHGRMDAHTRTDAQGHRVDDVGENNCASTPLSRPIPWARKLEVWGRRAARHDELEWKSRSSPRSLLQTRLCVLRAVGVCTTRCVETYCMCCISSPASQSGSAESCRKGLTDG